MQYKIKLLKSEEGYAVWCESLSGCFSQGETEEEAIENIKIAIEEYLNAQAEIKLNEKVIIVEV
jgi:predicted RNase H-like HicB family nuclease